jgi:hypothetical protein
MTTIHTPLERGQKNKVDVSRLFLGKRREASENVISKCVFPIHTITLRPAAIKRLIDSLLASRQEKMGVAQRQNFYYTLHTVAKSYMFLALVAR